MDIFPVKLVLVEHASICSECIVVVAFVFIVDVKLIM